MEDWGLQTSGGNACFIHVYGFDMGSFFVGHILDNHNHGTNSQVSKYRGPKPSKLSISNVDLMWKNGEWHGGTNKISIEFAYIQHARVHEFLEHEQNDLHTIVEWNNFKKCATWKNIKHVTIKHHLGHILCLCYLMSKSCILHK
jgi:hypothetical protein